MVQPRRVVGFRPEDERQETTNLGMVIFLASWAMMFGALFFSYGLLRLRSPGWPPPGVPELPLGPPSVATGLMVLSAVALWGAERGARRGRGRTVRHGLLGTVGLGALFLVVQVGAWTALWRGGFQAQDSVFASVFYLLTVFHGLHVVVGLALLARLIPAVLRAPLAPRTRGSLHVTGLFWHFVDVVWVLIFLTVYLL